MAEKIKKPSTERKVSLSNHPIYWSNYGVKCFFVSLILFTALVFLTKILLDRLRESHLKKNRTKIASIYDLKLARAPVFIWMNALKCKSSQTQPCIPAQMFWSNEAKGTIPNGYESISGKAPKTCGFCHPKKTEVTWVLPQKPVSFEAIPVVASAFSFFLLFLGWRVIARKKPLYIIRIDFELGFFVENKFFQSLSALYKEKDKSGITWVAPEYTFWPWLKKMVNLSEINKLPEGARLAVVQIFDHHEFPISFEAIKLLKIINSKTRTGQILLPYDVRERLSRKKILLEGKNAVWHAKTGEKHRFILVNKL